MINLALIGAGQIGSAHLTGASQTNAAKIVALVDPNPASKALATQFNVPLYANLDEMQAKHTIQGVIIGAPNTLHVPLAMQCLEHGLPVLVEKPIGDSVASAQALVEMSERLKIPVLTGHHRRHNPIIARAKSLIAQGALGKIVSMNVMALFYKTDNYFDVAWRREKGGGPILINLIHEIDLVRYLVGEVKAVQAMASNATRGFAVEDTVGILLHLENGAIVSISLSDCAVSPWSWDLSSGESLTFPRTNIESHFICGNAGSLTLPQLNFWSYREGKGWLEPISSQSKLVSQDNPYKEQIRHFAAVIFGLEQPIITARDATQTLRVNEAVSEAARTGLMVRV